MVLSLGLGRMISSPQHLRLHSIEVVFEACLVHLAGGMGLVKGSVSCANLLSRANFANPNMGH
jgi:hypothetical protein